MEVVSAQEDQPTELRFTALVQLGGLYGELRQLDKAESTFRQAATLFSEKTPARLQGVLHRNLGAVLQQRARAILDEAVRELKRSAQLLNEESDELWLTLEVYATTMLSLGEVRHAADCFEKCRAAFEKAGLWLYAMRTVVNLGICQYQCGKFAEAEASLRTAIAGNEMLGDRLYLARAFYHLAVALSEQGKIREAYDALEHARPNADPVLARKIGALESELQRRRNS